MTHYLSPTEVAVKLGMTPETIRRWVRDGTIEAVKVGRRVRIPEEAVARAFGTDAQAAALSVRLEHELTLHRPFGDVCAECGDEWPCDPIVATAEALDVDLARTP